MGMENMFTPDTGGFPAPEKELTEWDVHTFRVITATGLTDEQKRRITNPLNSHPRQESVLAIHWHPEYVPMPLIETRLNVMFPNRNQELIIPTQHNILMMHNGYAGVEVDCFSKPFNRKVQLLLHFENSRMAKADTLKSMLAHTFRYRSGQLFEYLHTITDQRRDDRLQEAAGYTGANKELITFVRIYAGKLVRLLEENLNAMPPEAVKNRLVVDYFEALRAHHDDRLINHALLFLKAVKTIVKRHFTLEYFYQTDEIIEETRGIGGGIVIPHPEQFWPILLADYDVDGYEVWNPQSNEYTEFLISVLNRQNKAKKRNERHLLIFMGDDCHMGEKTKEPARQDREKASREVGVQYAWDDIAIGKSLMMANVSRFTVIEEYKARLAG
ncbi:MAG: hypothetical protein HZA04_10780 [Nitrospinae bacterium]|nr:hypothetical protein [Nitrospinota bacterium]